MPYTDVAEIAEHLGRTLEGVQQTKAAQLALTATNHINKVLGRSWGASITDEPSEIQNVDPYTVVYTKYRPLASVEGVSVRHRDVTEAAVELVLDTGYRIISLEKGQIQLARWPDYYGYYALVSYTTSPVPEDIKYAATALAAHWLLLTLHPEMQRVAYLQTTEGSRVQYRSRDVPDEVKAILEGYPKSLVIA